MMSLASLTFTIKLVFFEMAAVAVAAIELCFVIDVCCLELELMSQSKLSRVRRNKQNVIDNRMRIIGCGTTMTGVEYCKKK